MYGRRQYIFWEWTFVPALQFHASEPVSPPQDSETTRFVPRRGPACLATTVLMKGAGMEWNRGPRTLCESQWIALGLVCSLPLDGR